MVFGGYLKYTGNIAGELMPRDFHGGPAFARAPNRQRGRWP